MPVAVLGILRSERAHGYALIRELDAKGFLGIQGGFLYPLLRRMEDEGLIASHWETAESGPARKAFTITNQGQSEFLDATDSVEKLNRLLKKWK